MEIVMWWFGLALLLLAAAVIFAILHQTKKKSSATNSSHKRPLAHSERYKKLASYKQTLIKMKRHLAIRTMLVASIIIFSAILASRVSVVRMEPNELRNRDIVLCLDVSGSMIAVDAEITDKFSEVANKLDGERIGLVLFDNTAVTSFPLTNDYDFIQKELKKTSESFKGSSWDIYSGTYDGEGSSIIGDGLASCILRFDNPEQERSRSIILATDNYLAGNPIVTLAEATNLAIEKKIRVYGLNPNDYSSDSSTYAYEQPNAKDFHDNMIRTGGDYYKLSSASAVDQVVDKINQQEATRFKGTPRPIYTDIPEPFVIGIIIAFCVLLFISRKGSMI